MASEAQITLLGRFAVTIDGRPIEIRSSKERALLTRLALEAGSVVRTDSLVESIWHDDDLPEDPARALRYHVWHLRGLLEPGRVTRSEGTMLLTRPSGYVLAIDPSAVDALRAETEWGRVRSLEADAGDRRDALAQLLMAWHPACFTEVDRGPLADAAVRLDRLRSAALGDRIAADIELGRAAELVPELTQLVEVQPFDEMLRGQLMVALYRAGRQADALALYAVTRTLLVEELGVEPGLELRELEHRILQHDATLGSPASINGRAPAAQPKERVTNLPYAVDSFVGRESELGEVRRLLDEHRLVTLTGAGGIGKTRLAVEAARALVAEYSDGVWLAELASVVDADLVPTIVAEVWGLAAAESDVSDVVAAFLQPRHALLVLDNCEHVNDTTSGLVSRLLREAPDVRILATSRETLGVPGEGAFRVASLGHGAPDDGPGPAATLFIDRGRAARPTWEPGADDLTAIDRICEQLDGIPLGLELAAGRLRSMSPNEIAGHLDGVVGTLAVASKNRLPRHRTLAAAVEWSYRLLSEAEQEVFRRASVFVGWFDLTAVRAVCSTLEVTTPMDDLVDSLVDKSLFIASPGIDGTRYRLLEPLRQWAHAQLSDDGAMDDARIAHAHHFARLIDELAADYHRFGQEAALRRTDADFANIRLALTTLVDIGDADHHLAMCFGLFSFWAHQSMHVEGFESCRRSLDLAQATPDLLAQAKTAVVGSICGAWTRRADAVGMAERARALAERLDDPRARAWAELALAVAHGNDGLPRGAGVAVDDVDTSGHMERAIRLFEERSGPSWWAPVWERGLQQLCCSIFLPYGPDRLAEFLDSKHAFESIGDRGWLAILYAQALDHVEFAGPDDTRRILEEGSRITISPSWSNSCRYRLGALHLSLGEYESAVESLAASLDYGRASGEGNWTAEARFLAIACSELDRLQQAGELLTSVFDEALDHRGDREVLRTLAAAAYVLEICGDLSLAARCLGRAEPFQDNFVDLIGTTRTRLSERLGADATADLVAAGAASDVAALVAEVRITFATLASTRQPG